MGRTPDEKRAADRAWALANPEKMRAYGRKWYRAHKEQETAAHRAWAQAHLEELRVYNRARYAANSEAKKASTRKWNAANKERHRAASSLWAATHREQHNANSRASYKRNPDSWKPKVARRRARKHNAPVNDFTLAEWRLILILFDHRCFYCGEKSLKLHQEHMTPLSRGGSHTAENIVPACATCNKRKGVKTAEEFNAERPANA